MIINLKQFMIYVRDICIDTFCSIVVGEAVSFYSIRVLAIQGKWKKEFGKVREMQMEILIE